MNCAFLLLNESIESFNLLFELVPLREVYYLISRIANAIGKIKARDEAANLFILCDNEIQNNSYSSPIILRINSAVEIAKESLNNLHHSKTVYHPIEIVD